MRTVVLAILLVAAAVPASALDIGQPAPDFTLPSTDGDRVSLSQFKGKRLVLLEFFGATKFPV